MLPPIYSELNFVREIRQKCFRLLGEGHSRQFVAERLKGAFIKRFHLKNASSQNFGRRHYRDWFVATATRRLDSFFSRDDFKKFNLPYTVVQKFENLNDFNNVVAGKFGTQTAYQ
ncbi:MAG TPA: hypothetical protein VHQ22_03530 [Terriglobales bacterium]|nr:hypothetical protein [Terriglobales bacterium]